MKVYLNEELREIQVESICTLEDVITQVETTMQQGHIITEVTLNDKLLEANWFQNSDKIYVLDDDTLKLKLEESSVVAKEFLEYSKVQLQHLLKEFNEIADCFRIDDSSEANSRFIRGIENLQYFLRILEDATTLLGRPMSNIVDKEVAFSQHINDLVEKLDQVLQVQANKDWIMLADMIEYEMIPGIEKLAVLYEILDI